MPTKLNHIRGGAAYADRLREISPEMAQDKLQALHTQLRGVLGTKSGILHLKNATTQPGRTDRELAFERKSWYQRGGHGTPEAKQRTADAVRILFERAGLPTQALNDYLAEHKGQLSGKAFRSLLGAQLQQLEPQPGVQRGLVAARQQLEQLRPELENVLSQGLAHEDLSQTEQSISALESELYRINRDLNQFIGQAFAAGRPDPGLMNEAQAHPNPEIQATQAKLRALRLELVQVSQSLGHVHASRALTGLNEKLANFERHLSEGHTALHTHRTALAELQSEAQAIGQLPGAEALTSELEQLMRDINEAPQRLRAALLGSMRGQLESLKLADQTQLLVPQPLQAALDQQLQTLAALVSQRDALDPAGQVGHSAEQVLAHAQTWDALQAQISEGTDALDALLTRCEMAQKTQSAQVERDFEAAMNFMNLDYIDRFSFKHDLKEATDQSARLLDGLRHTLSQWAGESQLSAAAAQALGAHIRQGVRQGAHPTELAQLVRTTPGLDQPHAVGRLAAQQWGGGADLPPLADLAAFACAAYPPAEQAAPLAVCLAGMAGLGASAAWQAGQPWQAFAGGDRLNALLAALPVTDKERRDLAAQVMRQLPVAASRLELKLTEPLTLPAGSALQLSAKHIGLQHLSAQGAVIRLAGEKMQWASGHLSDCRLVLAPTKASHTYALPDLSGLTLERVDIDLEIPSNFNAEALMIMATGLLLGLPKDQGAMAAKILQQLQPHVAGRYTAFHEVVMAAAVHFDNLVLPESIATRFNLKINGGWLGVLGEMSLDSILPHATRAALKPEFARAMANSPALMNKLYRVIEEEGFGRDEQALALRDRLMTQLDWSQPTAALVIAGQADLHGQPGLMARLFDRPLTDPLARQIAAKVARFEGGLQRLAPLLAKRSDSEGYAALLAGVEGLGEAMAEYQVFDGTLKTQDFSQPAVRAVMERSPHLLQASTLSEVSASAAGRQWLSTLALSWPPERATSLLNALRQTLPDLAAQLSSWREAMANSPFQAALDGGAWPRDNAALADYVQTLQGVAALAPEALLPQSGRLALLFLHGAKLDAQGPQAALRQSIGELEQGFLATPSVEPIVLALSQQGLASRAHAQAPWTFDPPTVILPFLSEADGRSYHLSVTEALLTQVAESPATADWSQALVWTSAAPGAPESPVEAVSPAQRRALLPTLVGAHAMLSKAYAATGSGMVGKLLASLDLPAAALNRLAEGMVRRPNKPDPVATSLMLQPHFQTWIDTEPLAHLENAHEWHKAQLKPEHLSKLRLWAEQQGIAANDMLFDQFLFALSASMTRMSAKDGLGTPTDSVEALRFYGYLLFKAAQPGLRQTLEARPELKIRPHESAEQHLQRFEAQFTADHCASLLSEPMMDLSRLMNEDAYIRAVPLRFMENGTTLERAKDLMAHEQLRDNPQLRPADAQVQQNLLPEVTPPSGAALETLPPDGQSVLNQWALSQRTQASSAQADYVGHVLALRRGLGSYQAFLSEHGYTHLKPAAGQNQPDVEPAEGGPLQMLNLSQFGHPVADAQNKLHHTAESWVVSKGQELVSDLALLDRFNLMAFKEHESQLQADGRALLEAMANLRRAQEPLDMLDPSVRIAGPLDSWAERLQHQHTERLREPLHAAQQQAVLVSERLGLVQVLQTEMAGRQAQLDNRLNAINQDLSALPPQAGKAVRLDKERLLLEAHRSELQAVGRGMHLSQASQALLKIVDRASDELKTAGLALAQ